MHIHYPPVRLNYNGKPRRAGFELEYTGLPLDRTAALVASHFGGFVSEDTNNHYTVDAPAFGQFGLELDVMWVKKLSEDAAREYNSLEDLAEKVLSPMVAAIMPYEIITPPLLLDTIPTLDKFCHELRAHGAKGTGASPLYAFGMQINPDLPAIDPAEVHRYLAAFLLLQDWLCVAVQPMDATRRLSPFAKPFDEAYCRHALALSYKPDLTTLMDDYLRFNPTRNRGLDMLPMFCFFDEAKVRAAVTDPKVKKRPTFHYRLPNCSLDEPDWSIVTEWNLWVEVERLAEDSERLAAMRKAYLAREDVSGWVDEVRQWMKEAWSPLPHGQARYA